MTWTCGWCGIVLRSGCRMDRFASSVFPWPYEAVALGSNRCVISYCALGDTSYCALKTRTWCLYRASLMVSKSASEILSVSQVFHRRIWMVLFLLQLLPLPYFLDRYSPDILLIPTPCTSAPNRTLDSGRCVSGCIEALEEAIVAYDAACRPNPPSFRKDIVFTYSITESQSVSEFDAGLVSEMTDANGFQLSFILSSAVS